MRAQRSGSIVLTASVSGLTAWSHAAPYCATKAAVIQLAKVAAVEYARDGIRVNCVCPGTFLSAIHADLPQEALDAIAAKHPLGLGSADDLVGRVLVPRERRVPLDDRVGDRGRRRLRGAVGDRWMRADASGHELVRSARAPRPPHAGQAARDLRRRDRHLRRDGDARRPRSPPGCTNAASAPATSSGCSRTTAPSSWRRSSPRTTSGAIAMPINWRLAAPELRYILDHSEARALVCDESLVDLADEATTGHGTRRSSGSASRDRHPTAGRRSPISASASSVPARVAGGR